VSANLYWWQQTIIDVSKLLLLSANYYWCQQTSVGVSKLLLVSAKFCWCQQTTIVSANLYWWQQTIIDVTKLLLVLANYYWCHQTSVGVSKTTIDVSKLLLVSANFFVFISLYRYHHINKHRQMQTLHHHFINTVHNCNMLQHLKGHLQGEQVIHSSSMGQQHESSAAKFNLLHTQLNFTTGESCRWTTLLECINCTPWKWASKCWNILGWTYSVNKVWFKNIWLHLTLLVDMVSGNKHQLT